MTPFFSDHAFDLHVGDVREVLAGLPEGSVQTCVTSPPYFGLRDYGTARWEGGDADCDHLAPAGGGTGKSGLQRDGRPDHIRQGNAERIVRDRQQQYRVVCRKCGARRVDQQIGLEETPEEYVAHLVEVFRGVRSVLRDDGTVWLNLGDTYASQGGHGGNGKSSQRRGRSNLPEQNRGSYSTVTAGLKDKDLVGIPWMVAFALRADGWYLRSEVIWAKRNPMPESVTDRPTKAHEQLFLLAKSPRYFYDAEAVKEPHHHDGRKVTGRTGGDGSHENHRLAPGQRRERWPGSGRNKRDVWTIAGEPFPGAHFAVYPQKLVIPCVEAGTSGRGGCAECGAPWRRVVEKEPIVVRPSAKRKAWQESDERARTQFGGTVLRDGSSETVGWEPSCSCDAGTEPQLVLDPFMGSGTTAIVARSLGRRAVGVELNPEYAEIAVNRYTTGKMVLR